MAELTPEPNQADLHQPLEEAPRFSRDWSQLPPGAAELVKTSAEKAQRALCKHDFSQALREAAWLTMFIDIFSEKLRPQWREEDQKLCTQLFVDILETSVTGAVEKEDWDALIVGASVCHWAKLTKSRDKLVHTLCTSIGKQATYNRLLALEQRLRAHPQIELLWVQRLRQYLGKS